MSTPEPTKVYRRRLDYASLALLALGCLCMGMSLRYVVNHDVTPLLLIPSLISIAIGATHLTKTEARAE